MRDRRRANEAASASDRAVSDVIGFVLVFSLVALIVGTVYISGMGGLEGARDSERLTNAERAFDVLSENMDDVVDTGARSRSTEIKLSNAQLGFGDPVELKVNMTNTGANYTASVRPIVFSIGDTDVVYANGAVIRSDPGGSVMLHEPTMVSGDRTLLPIIVTRGRSSGIGGSGRVLVRSVEATNDVVRFDNPPAGSPYDVEISVTTPRTRAWERYLENQFDTTCSVSGQNVTCGPFPADRVDLQVVKIDVRIS